MTPWAAGTSPGHLNGRDVFSDMLLLKNVLNT
jgi:hypothetical protein